MFNEAFAQIAAGFSAMHGGPFGDATIRAAGAPVYDDGGSIVTAGPEFYHVVKAQFDAPTEQMRQDPGFIERDMRLIVLACASDYRLQTGATLITDAPAYAGTWTIETCQSDPVGIGWECRARQIA